MASKKGNRESVLVPRITNLQVDRAIKSLGLENFGLVSLTINPEEVTMRFKARDLDGNAIYQITADGETQFAVVEFKAPVWHRGDEDVDGVNH